jgi:hypothetical protein
MPDEREIELDNIIDDNGTKLIIMTNSKMFQVYEQTNEIKKNKLLGAVRTYEEAQQLYLGIKQNATTKTNKLQKLFDKFKL